MTRGFGIIGTGMIASVHAAAIAMLSETVPAVQALTG